MAIDDQIKNRKPQHDCKIEAAKIPALPSDNIDKYQYLTGEEILPSNQKQIIEQAKFTFSFLGRIYKNKQKQWKIKSKNKLML